MTYKINVLGAGPTGMFTATLLKKQFPLANISLYEQKSREKAFGGIGYTFIESIFDFFGHLGKDSLKNISRDNPSWDLVEIVGKSGSVVNRKPRFSYTGVERIKIMHELERVVNLYEIPISYDVGVNNKNFDKFKDGDLTIVCTGARRFLSPEKLVPFRTFEIDSQLRYHWFQTFLRGDMFSLTFSKLKCVPFIQTSYPVSSNNSAVILEVLDKDIGSFSRNTKNQFDIHLKPEMFFPVPCRWTERPLVDNVLFLGDASCTPYFGSGMGLYTSFSSVLKLLDAVKNNNSLISGLKQFVLSQQDTYKELFETGLSMIDEKVKVLKEFDNLSESEQVRLVTGRALNS